jgi:nucleoside 2-deoxyribosyltransferase
MSNYLLQQFICEQDGIYRYNAKVTPRLQWQSAYVNSMADLLAIIQLANQINYIELQKGYINQIVFELTITGLKRAEELISTNIDSNQIFIAMKFDDPETKERREDFINTVKKACEEASGGKLEAKIVQDKEFNDGIADKIKSEIRTSKAVIADYTFENQGVYFEAGFADGLGIPVIRCCEEKWALEHDGGIEKAVHFDERHNNMIFWKSYSNLHERLINRIRNILL